MRAGSIVRKRRPEKGIALLISIFILLLISVVAIALIVSSGTESALAGNYRSSTSVYYAALAGLEEGRGRLLAKNPNSFNNTSPSFIPTPGPLPLGQVRYILNPAPSETAGTILTTYPDNEYQSEFGAPPVGANVQTTASVSTAGGIQGPLYKWVRLNAVSEQSLNLLVAPYAPGPLDSTSPVYYDSTIGTGQLNITPTGSQVLEITSLAVLPNGSQKLLQYLVAPTQLSLNFPASVVLDGNTPQFTAPMSPSFWVRGNDQGSAGTCNPTTTAFTAMGYTTGSLSNFVQPSNPSGIAAGPPPSPDLRDHYTNGVAAIPDINAVTLSPNLTTVAGLNALVQTIQQNADVVVNANATQADMPASMSATNPMIIVINGDLTFSSWRSTGYGLLLVTGEFTFDPDASWNGIILVIGKGWMYCSKGAYTVTQIQGAVLLARTVDASNNPLPPSSPLGSPNFQFNYSGTTNTHGIYYSSCWIQASLPSLGYKILSFHEISQ